MDRQTPVFGKPADFYSKELETTRRQYSGGAYGVEGGILHASPSIEAYDYAVIKICAALVSNPAFASWGPDQWARTAYTIADKLFQK